MKIIKRGFLGRFSGNGSKNMPGNGETFIDARPRSKELQKKYPELGTHNNSLVTSCHNCGDYSHITKEQAIEFLTFLGYEMFFPDTYSR